MLTLAQQQNADSRKRVILSYLSANRDWRTTKQINRSTGVGLANVRRALKELFDEGCVKRATTHYGSLAHATVWASTPLGDASAFSQ